MANNFFKVKKGLKIEPNTVAGTEAGDIRVDSADSNKPKFYNGSSEAIVPTVTSADTLSNKTIVAANNTITTAASGNLTSVELNAALAELQSDVDTRAPSSDLSTHISDTTTHGTTGDIVGTSDSQTLTNKTFDADSNTLSNVDDGNIKAGAAIARSKLASGSASHVLINDGSGVASSEATLAKSRGGAGADMSSVTFPSTGTIVTRAATEDLSGKTFTDPITLEEQASSPSAPSSGDRKLYSKTDGKVYHMGSDGVEKAVGSGAGGGVNYHDDYDCDNIAKVSTYDDGAATPTDGTGGTVNYASAALETSSPLAGTASYKLSKSANNAQGEGWAIDSSALDDMETVAGQMLWVDFSYKTSANFVADDVKVYVYRVGSNTLEALNTFQGSSMSNTLPVAPNGARYTGWVTCSSSDTSIRLILHVASTNATAYDIHVDRLSIGPQSVVQSGIQSDWQSYTPTGSWVSNTTYVGKWRRAGDSMDLQVDVQLTGAPTATALTVNLPSGLTIDTAKRNASAASVGDLIGFASVLDSGTLEYTVGSVQYSSATALDVRYDNGSSGASGVNATAPITFATGDRVYIRAFGIPISGWTSGNTMSTAELSVKSALVVAAGNGGEALTANTTNIPFSTETIDSHGAWNGTQFTVPATGYYNIEGAIYTTTTTASGIELYIDAAQDRRISDFLADNINKFSCTMKFTKGQVLSFRSLASKTLSNNARLHWLTIMAVPDLTIIGINGVAPVMARYTSTAGQSISNATVAIVDFATKTYDTHNAVTTGASWKFTAPVAGKYSIKAAMLWGSAAFSSNVASTIYIYKNGSVYTVRQHRQWAALTTSYQQTIDDTVQLAAGDYIDIRVDHGESAARSIHTASGYTAVTIERLSDY